MSENLTQCSVCRTLIPPERAVGKQPPLLCDECLMRQATAQSSEFPFATFIRFRASVKVVATMLLVIAIFQFAALIWSPILRAYFYDSRMNPRGYALGTILLSGLPSIVLWNILFPIFLLMVRRALLAFSEMMSDLFVASYKERL